MHTWPELLAHLKHLQKLAATHQGSKGKELEKRIVDLLEQTKKMSTRELGASQHSDTHRLLRSPLGTNKK
jgi:hypothetical protein